MSKLKSHKFRGAGVALVTPFDKKGSIDFLSMEKLIEHVIKNKIDFVLLSGTTGESPVITSEEKKELKEFLVKTVKKRVPILLGMGGNNTAELLSSFKKMNFDGIDGVLSVCPYYNKPSQEGLFQHYKAVSEVSPAPVILYNVPGRSVINIEPETTLRLADACPNIIGIKEATDNLDHVMKLIKQKPDGFLVTAGDDALALPLISIGADGLISVMSNAFPKEFSEMVNLALNNDFDKARKIHYKLHYLMQGLLSVGNPGGIKAILDILQIVPNRFRLPYVPISKEKYKELSVLVEKYLTNS
ncbi:MAG: 4-hydroxy-tetrahydrodipicolinate synthase [Bacteroidota bacterium]